MPADRDSAPCPSPLGEASGLPFAPSADAPSEPSPSSSPGASEGASPSAPEDDGDARAASSGALTPATWQDFVRSVYGAAEPRNIMQAELALVREWVRALEEDLAEPATAADLSLLGSIGRLKLLELRLARCVFERGATTEKGGKVKPAAVEHRATARLIADLLRMLSFKRVPVKLPGLRDRWRSTEPSSPNGDGAEPVATEASCSSPDEADSAGEEAPA